jgi:hypothetical protein
MEEATGDQLGEIWHEMELHDKLKIVDDIIDFERRLLSLSFTWSVSLCRCIRASIIDRDLQLWKPLLRG